MSSTRLELGLSKTKVKKYNAEAEAQLPPTGIVVLLIPKGFAGMHHETRLKTQSGVEMTGFDIYIVGTILTQPNPSFLRNNRYNGRYVGKYSDSGLFVTYPTSTAP